jgi:hypothetical protein
LEIDMPTRFLPLTHLARPHAEACTRLAWFIFGCLEREHLLNIKALAKSPPGVAWWWTPQGVCATCGTQRLGERR